MTATSPLCPRCTATTLASEGESYACRLCGTNYGLGPYPQTLKIDLASPKFSHEIDREITSVLVPALDELPVGSCTEKAIAKASESRGDAIGNPYLEYRADVARLVPQARGVVADIGCGLGTIATSLARNATHVFALDQSSERVAITAARARAEGLVNLTAVKADGLSLPFGDATIDLLSCVGVLEWLGVGSEDPIEAQSEALNEFARVLKPSGMLLIGIENRYGGHYFLGAREEHLKLPFVSVLPRRLARWYVGKRLNGRALDVLTHSRRKLTQMLRDAGFPHVRFAYPLPSYSEMQMSIDEDDFRSGRDFYLRHVFHYSSHKRRLAAALFGHAPLRLVEPVIPSFWVAATKGALSEPLGSVVTGTGYCFGDVKEVRWTRRDVVRRPRRDASEASDVHPLVAGWNARRWITAPFTTKKRQARTRGVARAAGFLLSERTALRSDREIEGQLQGVFHTGLELLESKLSKAARSWLSREGTGYLAAASQVVREHGDFILSNLIWTERPNLPLVAIDEPEVAAHAPHGSDAAFLVLDIVGALRGEKEVAVDAILRVERSDLDVRTWIALRGLLDADGGPWRANDLALGVAVALVRYSGSKEPFRGTVRLIEAAATGELASKIKLLGLAE